MFFILILKTIYDIMNNKLIDSHLLMKDDNLYDNIDTKQV